MFTPCEQVTFSPQTVFVDWGRDSRLSMGSHCLLGKGSFCVCWDAIWSRAYILKAKKFAELPFQSKKLRKNAGYFWAILGLLGPFWAIFGPFWVIFAKLREVQFFLRDRWGRNTFF